MLSWTNQYFMECHKGFDCCSVVLLLELSFWRVQVSNVVVDVVFYPKEDIVVSSLIETMWGSFLFLNIWFLCGQFATKTKYHWHRDIPNKYPLCKVYMGLILKGTVPPFSLWHWHSEFSVLRYLFCFFFPPSICSPRIDWRESKSLILVVSQ